MFGFPVFSEAVGGLGKKEDDERPDLFGGVEEVVVRYFREGRVGGAEKVKKGCADMVQLWADESVWVKLLLDEWIVL